MSPSPQLTSERLKDIIEDEKKTDQGTTDVQEQGDGEEVLDPDKTSSLLSTVLNTTNNEFGPQCLEEAVRLLNAHLICQSTNDGVPGHTYSIPGLPRMKFLAHQLCAIWFIVRNWVWDAAMPGTLVADGKGLGKTFTSVVATMICKLLTEKVVMGLPLSILWGNTLAGWVNMVHLHPIAWCFLFLLFPVSWAIFNCASRVIFLVAAFAVSR